MEHKTVKIYAADEITDYDALVKAIVSKAPNADLHTDIENYRITVAFSDKHPEEIDLLAKGIANIDVTIKDKPFMFAADEEAEERMLAEAALTKEALDRAIAEIEHQKIEKSKVEEDRDKYKKWYDEANARNFRVYKQGRAIATLLDSLFPNP